MNFSTKLLGMTCASVIALGVGSVNAADLYHGGGLKDGPYVPPVVAPIWTGFYVGIDGGGSFGASENLRVTNNADATEADIGQFYRDGGFGGGQIGYNWSGFGWGNQVVLGVETDIQGSGISSSFDRNDLNYSTFINPAFHASQNIDYFGTVRGRLGYAVGPALIYATGGFAYANVDTTVTINSGANVLNSNRMETGWVVGGGVEYLFALNWSGKVEYQYIDLGSQTISGVDTIGVTDRMPFDNTFHTVRAGINYHVPTGYAPLK
jgi:outer membrane immunogenic protein